MQAILPPPTVPAHEPEPLLQIGLRGAVLATRKTSRAAQGIVSRGRRIGSKTTITVSLERDIIRVVVFSGKQPLAWGSASPDLENLPDKKRGAAIRDAAAACLKDLLKDLDAGKGRVVTDFPLYATLIRQLRLPRVKGKYLEPMVLTEVAEHLPFDRSEVDISWRSEPDKTGQNVLAVAASCDGIDRQARLLRRAGLTPRATYPRALALILAAGVSDGLVAHLEEGRVAVTLAQAGVPVIAHQVEFPESAATATERAEAVARALDQVAGYHDDASGANLPVILTGPLANSRALADTLQEQGFRLAPCQPGLKLPPSFSVAEYAANVGLLLADRQSKLAWLKPQRPGSARLNLLPERHLPRRAPITAIASFVALGLFAVVAFHGTGFVNEAAAQASGLRQTRNTLNEQRQQQRLAQSRKDLTVKNAQTLEQQAKSIDAQLLALQRQADSFMGQLTAARQEAALLGITIDSLDNQGASYSMQGKAASPQSVMEYANRLQASGRFAEARVLTLQSGGVSNIAALLTGEAAITEQPGSAQFQMKLIPAQ